MNLMQKDNIRELSILRLGLADFGLKPDEWQLHQEQTDTYTIENIDTPEFCFLGMTESQRGNVTWRKISLKSV